MASNYTHLCRKVSRIHKLNIIFLSLEVRTKVSYLYIFWNHNLMACIMFRFSYSHILSIFPLNLLLHQDLDLYKARIICSVKGNCFRDKKVDYMACWRQYTLKQHHHENS